MQLRLDELPHELLLSIFSFQLDPHKLIDQLVTFAHVNRTLYDLVMENHDEFWFPMMNLQLRQHDDTSMMMSDRCSNYYFPTHYFIDDLLLSTHRNKFRENWTKEMMENEDDNEDDNDLNTQPIYRTTQGDLITYIDSNESDLNLFEQFSMWTESCARWNGFIFKALIQLCLGREMISHIGISQVGVLIEMFFEKLFEPAVELVRNWEEKPKELEWKDDLIFNLNLLKIIEEPKSLFGEDIATCWSEFDGLSCCIPRKYLLFIIEKFNNIRIISKNSTSSSCMITQIMKRLRDCGIKVERMRFSDVGTMKNYERIECMDSIIPIMSKSFYLQHVAVWINSAELLEWCLNDGQQFTDTNELVDNSTEMDVKFTSHTYINTYVHDSCGLTALHYAVQCGNFELSNLLIDKYAANPFVQSKIMYNKHGLTPCDLSQIISNQNTTEMTRIYQLLLDKYGETKVKIEKTSQNVKDVDRLNDFHKLTLEKMDADVWYDTGNNYMTSVQWREKEEFKAMKEFLQVENGKGRWTDDLDDSDESPSDESDHEYGLSHDWIKKEILRSTSHKRKRNPSKDFVNNENLRKLRKPLEELEFTNWNAYQHEYLCDSDVYYQNDEYDESWPHIKILKRKPNSIEKEQKDKKIEETEDEIDGKIDDETDEEIEEQEGEKLEEISEETLEEKLDKVLDETEEETANENHSAIEYNEILKNKTLHDDQDYEIGPEYILRKDLTIPKKRMNNLLQEISNDFKHDTFIMPNAQMLIQQASEQFISDNFQLAQQIAKFSGRDHVNGHDVKMAGTLFSSHVIKERTFNFGSRKKKAIKRYRDHIVENLNINLKDVKLQLLTFIQDEILLQTLIESIDNQFENVYLNEIQDEKLDADYESSDEEEESDEDEEYYYSDDSMTSNVCIEENFYGHDLGSGIVYSSTTTQTFLKQKTDAIYLNQYDYFTVREVEHDDLETRLIFPLDREQAISWLDGSSLGYHAPDEEYLD